ncbi:MAG: ABC transporter substrate-binding protein [Clostridiales bacterium]|nr:ABC transporter substrate-binding protein [Clostridiales bacterium]
MKKIFAIALAAMMITVMFAGCGNSGSDDASFVIGGVGPLTGDYATYGVSVKQGAELAVKEINAAGGINGVPVELLFEDDQVDAEMAVNAYNKLMDDGMDVSLGAVTSGACIAVSEKANEDGILMITPSGSQVECIQYPNAFRICFGDPEQGVNAAKFLANNNVAKKIAIIYDKSNDYSNGIKETFVSVAPEYGLEIVSEQAFTNQSNTDFSVQLQTIAGTDAELIFLPIYAQEAAYILTQAQSAGMEHIFFGGDGMDGIVEKIGADNVSATNGLMFLTPFDTQADEQNIKFTADYQAAYNATPDQFAGDGYDAIYTIKAAAEKANVKPGDADFNEKIIAAMTEITVDGTTGTMTWTADGAPEKAAAVVVLQDGVPSPYVAK